MQFVNCTYDAHAQQILAIFNEVIHSSTALYDYKPHAPTAPMSWMERLRRVFG